MIANYHTHTWRCNHAVGAEEEYARHALDRGLEILGFADHTPYFFPGAYYSSFRMKPDQLEDYVRTVLSLRERYKGQLQIPLGLETEFYPALIPQLLPILRDLPIDYLLLGQHFIGNEIGEPYSGSPTGDERVLARYCAQVAEAMHSGLFTYVAHPDLLFYRGDRGSYEKHMRLICREARSCGIALELNLLGLQSGRNYPDPVFWGLAAQEGCQVILGCDAHRPEALSDRTAEETAMQMVRDFGLNLVETVPLRKI